MTLEQLKELAKHAAHRTAPAEYSVESVDAAVCEGFKALTGSINDFLKNRYDIFSIIIENVDDVVPAKVIDALGAFAEVKTVEQGKKAMFRVSNIGKVRARKFLTQVGLSGVYETFRLDAGTFELGGHAVGGAITMDFERFLDGAETLADLMDVLTTGLTDAVFVEVQRALTNAISEMTALGLTNNYYATNGFAGDKMLKIISVVRSYGSNAIIFATPEFVAAMGPDAIVPTLMNSTTNVAQGLYHPQDIDAIHNTGYITLFRGTPIVQIPQSFADEKNQTRYINPQFAYILPAGKEKVVKVVLEGATQMWSETNKDQSIEINAYKKIGCAILHYNNWGIYQNTGIDVSTIPVVDLYGY